MFNARSLFFLLVLIAFCHFGNANHDDDDNDVHVHTGRCKKHHPEEDCKDFCDSSICDDGDCVCKSDWKGSGSSTCTKATARIGRSHSNRCEEIGAKYNTCPFLCTATSLKNKVKSFCVVWENSGPCKTGGGRPRPTSRPTKPPRPGDYDPAPKQGRVD